jgi:hypothetical protein
MICARRRYAFVASERIYQSLKRELPCAVVGIPRAYYSKAVSLILRKGNPMKRLFTYQLSTEISDWPASGPIEMKNSN